MDKSKNSKQLSAMIRRHKHLPIIAILLLSLIIKIVYVFFFTDYPHYLFSDMGGYWVRALERFYGQDTILNQWVVWPPFYHIALSFYLRFIYFIGLFAYKLEWTLLLNITLSTISVFLVYLIAKKIFFRERTALLVAAAYAFTYPLIYFNAFIMSENFAIPVLLAAILFLFSDRKISLALSGVLLAAAVAARPAYGLIFFAFVIYLFFKNASWKSFVIEAGIFAAIFASFLGLVVAENYRISGGKVTGLSANGGICFYFMQTKTYQIISRFDSFTYTFVPPSAVPFPQNGTLDTPVPIYEQKYFYALALDHLKKHPSELWNNVLYMKNLFFGPLLPSVDSAAGFPVLIKISQGLIFIVALSFPGFLVALFVGNKALDRKKYLLFVLIPIFSLITFYFFGVEQRYLYSFLFAIYIVFFGVAQMLVSLFENKKQPVDEQV